MSTSTLCSAFPSSKNMACWIFPLLLAWKWKTTVLEIKSFFQGKPPSEVSLPPPEERQHLLTPHPSLLTQPAQPFHSRHLWNSPYFSPSSSELFKNAWVALFCINQLVCQVLPSDVSWPSWAAIVLAEPSCCFREIFCLWARPTLSSTGHLICLPCWPPVTCMLGTFHCTYLNLLGSWLFLLTFFSLPYPYLQPAHSNTDWFPKASLDRKCGWVPLPSSSPGNYLSLQRSYS